MKLEFPPKLKPHILELKEFFTQYKLANILNLIENSLFSTYDKHIQNFLLELSMADNFTAEQAFFITHEEESDRILKKLRQENAKNIDEEYKDPIIAETLIAKNLQYLMSWKDAYKQ